MRIIYLDIQEGVVIGWGSSLENAPSVEIAEDDEFFSTFYEVEYEFVEGVLRKKESI